jgi:murein DD-endopeptidase MepM/ murein hydrolase activator NlpD
MYPRVLFILLALFCSFNAAAKKLYKYRDEQGNWHFTDRPPEIGVKAEVSQLKAEHQQRVWLNRSEALGVPAYSVRNDYPGPVEVEIAFEQHRNAGAVPRLPARFTVMPGNSKPLLQVFPVDSYRGASYALKLRYVMGSPEAHHDASVLYLTPFDVNGRFQITQGFDGKMSHQDPQNKYAVDIAMPEGTPVYAARGGVVMEVENDFYESGMKQSNLSRANNIRILHDDGSIAVYAHLQLEAAQAYPGLKVEAGQLIGYSGNTGFSSGPHLHFAVQINNGMELISVPFKFASGNSAALEPKEGMWLDGVGKAE